MTIQQAEDFLRLRDSERLKVNRSDSFRLKWAKASVANHAQLLARCQTEKARQVVTERYAIHLTFLVGRVLAGEL